MFVIALATQIKEILPIFVLYVNCPRKKEHKYLVSLEMCGNTEHAATTNKFYRNAIQTRNKSK